MSLESKRDQLIIEIEKAIKGFNSGIPGIQKEIYRQVLLALKELEVKNGVIQNNATNIKLIRQLQQRIGDAVLNEKYLAEVKTFMRSFTTVTTIQNDYFGLIQSGWKPYPALQEVKLLSIQNTINSLTESGINANVTSKIEDILLQNITSAVKYEDMVEQMRTFIMGNPKVDGALVRYASTITTDSLNTYAATYTKMISDDLGLEWYMYIGSNIATTRCFCLAATKKKYIHISEFQKMVDGNFEEFRELNCTIYEKTGLPQGMKEETTAANFQQKRGGHKCGHQVSPVLGTAVPANIRARFES